MKKGLTILAILLVFHFMSSRADEGMWLPLLMTSKNYDAMKARGFRMSPEDLYSVNHASLKDAIVLFGSGCTGELVSAEGLLLTNHHCGYSRIQSHSSLVNDYLTQGFWAANKNEELSNPGLTASILVRMEDVTPRVEKVLNPSMTEKERTEAVRKVSADIVAKATKGTHYDAEVKSFFHGNQFILVVMEVFKDVRLVGAPPSAIGKFGGDTDNWMWPRHTGDFSIFRIYADKDNKPAPYTTGNIPYKPRKFLEISLKGVKEGDFTLVYGFPFQTEQYLPSYAISLYQHDTYPAIITVRDKELEIINAAMASSPERRIMYAARQASVANAWKKYMGVVPGLERFNVLEKKRMGEKKLISLLEDDPILQNQYRNIMQGYEEAYRKLQPMQNWNTHFTECFWKQPFFRFLFKGYWLPMYDPDSKEGQENSQKVVAEIQKAIPGFYKSIDMETEKKLMTALISLFITHIPEEQLPPALLQAKKKHHGDYDNYVSGLFRKSAFASEKEAEALFKNWKPSNLKKLLKDPLFNLMTGIVDQYRNEYHPGIQQLTQTLDSLHRLNMKIILEMRNDPFMYPDANATLRISYGQVQSSYPRDGVRYLYQTTLEGIFMKEDPDIEDYTVPERLKQIADPVNYPPYSVSGTMPVAFLASNHTTGGNSGSPVLDAHGRLIGINFDRAWEGTMSDLFFEPSICRNISIDIRYLLFIVDKYAGATHLTDEMVIHK